MAYPWHACITCTLAKFQWWAQKKEEFIKICITKKVWIILCILQININKNKNIFRLKKCFFIKFYHLNFKF